MRVSQPYGLSGEASAQRARLLAGPVSASMWDSDGMTRQTPFAVSKNIAAENG
jgi:hypothetical protein